VDKLIRLVFRKINRISISRNDENLNEENYQYLERTQEVRIIKFEI